jgi:hypothetical protein
MSSQPKFSWRFRGLSAAQALKSVPVDVMLIDPRN